MSYPEFPFHHLPQTITVQEACNPYLVITAFFSDYRLPRAVKLLDKWMRSAFAEKSRLGKNDSLSILHLQEQVIRLLEAGQLMNDDTANNEKALDRHTIPDIQNTALYYKPDPVFSAWECFPRYLGRAEYINPYLVFEKCVGQLDLAGWRKFLKDLFYAAAYDTHINEAVNDDDLYYTCKCLFKLVEACYIIKVREIDPGIAQGPANPRCNHPMQPSSQLTAVNA